VKGSCWWLSQDSALAFSGTVKRHDKLLLGSEFNMVLPKKCRSAVGITSAFCIEHLCSAFFTPLGVIVWRKTNEVLLADL
jgi:hypothetical protein